MSAAEKWHETHVIIHNVRGMIEILYIPHSGGFAVQLPSPRQEILLCPLKLKPRLHW